ncbi:MAG: NAD(P)/FAD-dependent oxidoreductase [Myxococcaceae bacterium]|nr:NAD(P)/FAD-dependent oxidoreductase [Myxococcaceae bacterium]
MNAGAGAGAGAWVREEHDVIIVGAGLSGIGAAYRLKTECPDRSFVVLDGREAIGGTWDLFRYPGVRSDSDMFTLGYPFNPWRSGRAIADGPSILSYVRETAQKFGLQEHVRLRHRVLSARWSSDEARWAVEVQAGATVRTMRCRFLYLCCGYYDYEAAHAPQFPGIESFKGRVVHPQWWPEDLDYTDQRVVVIGSGATAVTLVPAMADRAARVTMLQRSPSYVASLPTRDIVADALRFVLPDELAHGLIRTKNMLLALGFYLFCRRFPRAAARLILAGVRDLLPRGYPVEKHFAPAYAPWDQRLCMVPDGDLFKAISLGRAEVVTDTIAGFDATGIRLSSGGRVDADVVVTATGLKLKPVGGVQVFVDGRPLVARDAIVYKGMMFSDVPNLAWCVGYTNASWTLRADLSSRYVCRLLEHMRKNGFDIAVPRGETAGPDRRPLLDFQAGYVTRALSELPQQGARAPWYLRQNYVLDFFSTLFGRVDDSAMAFSRAGG